MDLNFKKIIAWLKRNKIDYTIKDNRIVLFHDANGCVEFVFNSGKSIYNAPRGCLMASSAADGSDFYVEIGDWGKWINEFLDWAKDRGYYEYNHYHCAQWGTWKFGNFISMSFFGVFIKKILALKNGVNESMQLDEAKHILNKNGFILEDYNFYRNPFNQMNRKHQEEKKQELVRLRASFCDNPDCAKVGSITSPYNGDAVYGKQMWDDGVPVMKYWYRDNKTIAVTLKQGTPCIVLLDKDGEYAQDVWVKYNRGWLRIDGDSIEVEF